MQCFLYTKLTLVQLISCQTGEPLINISSTPSSNKLAIGAAINLTCTAWQSDKLAKKPWTRPHIIEWFDPQDKRIGFQCRAGRPPARLMKCTLEVGALRNETLGSYTCRARNGYHFCSTKKFKLVFKVREISLKDQLPKSCYRARVCVHRVTGELFD